nr:hypothetical protein [Paenibacillus alba]
MINKGRVFYWSVKEDIEDYGRTILHIVSEDKKYIISYAIGQSLLEKNTFIVIQGMEFEGLAGYKRFGWTRVLTPSWEDTIITPRLVVQIIDWCFEMKEQVTIVDWKGNVTAIIDNL